MSWCPNCNNFVSRVAPSCRLCGAANPDWAGIRPVTERPQAEADRAKLAALIRSMAYEERLTLMLCYADGLDAAEIGQVLGVAPQFAAETLRVAVERCAEEIVMRET